MSEVGRIRSTDFAQRATALKARREHKMARSVQTYVRGSTERFYRWIDEHAQRMIPTGPDVWICGDCHVGNLGPVGRREGDVVIEMRDLDQTVIGNPALDLVRIGLSLAMDARSSLLPGVTTAHMTEELVAGYEAAFEGQVPTEKLEELPEPIRLVMREATRRTWKHLFDERFGGRTEKLPLGRRFWPLSAEERTAIDALVASESVRQLVSRIESRDDDVRLELLDAAFWVKGCSSLGLWRVAVLVDAKGKKKRKSRCLLDVKEAIETWAPAASRAQLPRSEGMRVVMGARKLAPALGERMTAATVLDREVFIRELLPQDLKMALDDMSSSVGRAAARYLGLVVGRAHARQLDAASRKRWLDELSARRLKSIDAPPWLWASIVDLVAEHERAYLEHCRRFAMNAT